MTNGDKNYWNKQVHKKGLQIIIMKMTCTLRRCGCIIISACKEYGFVYRLTKLNNFDKLTRPRFDGRAHS